jgi:hypothetical protein
MPRSRRPREQLEVEICGVDNPDQPMTKPRGDHVSFRWRHPHKSWWSANRPIVLDLTDASHRLGMWRIGQTVTQVEPADIRDCIDGLRRNLFVICKLHAKIPCRGWGRLIDRSMFVARVSEPRPAETR